MTEIEHNGVVAVGAAETSKDARQLLADITAGLEGVTPGTWHPGHLGTDLTCQCSSIVDEGRYAGGIAKVYVGNGKPISDGGNDCPPAEEAAANMRHIARCNPHAMQTIDRQFTALTLELSAAKQRIAELEAALRPFAEAESCITWQEGDDQVYTFTTAAELILARAALPASPHEGSQS